MVQCLGCGASLQTESVESPGYVPQSALGSGQSLCRRCFRIRNYGEFSKVAVTEADYAAEVSRIVDRPGLVLYVLDVFDLSGSLVHPLARYTVGSKVMVVVNKTDVLPREVDPRTLESWVRERVEQTGIEPIAIHFVSATKSQGFAELVADIEAESEGTVYAVGMANVGKSSVLNQLLAQAGVDKETFTASRMPGTTLSSVGIDVSLEGRTIHIVDTPGLIHGNRITDSLCARCLNDAVPTDRLRPRVYQLDQGQSLWLGGFARIDFEQGPHQSLVVYVSNRLVVHRTKLERADAIYAERAAEVLQCPCTDCRQALGPLVRYPIVDSNQGSKRHASDVLSVRRSPSDIVLAGLGWIALQGRPFRGTLHVPKGIDVEVRPKLVGGLATDQKRRG